MTTAQALRTEAAGHEQEAQDSFDRCDTDGFLSQWASGLTAQLKRRQAEILEAGGVAEFPALFTLDGERVNARLIDTRYGRAWAMMDDGGAFTGEFVSAFPKRESTMTKKGYREGTEVAPARAVMQGQGTGLSGTAWVAVIRVDGK
jgi:hypothetical protein